MTETGRRRSIGVTAVGLALGVLCVRPAPAAADVVDRAAGGFTLRATLPIAAPAERVYRALVDIGSWWGGDHTYSGSARNMTIDARPGGCWCEKLPKGGGVEHGRVVNVAPGSLLRLHAALGPLQELAVTGSLTWEIMPGASGSTLTMTYVVGGYTQGGLAALADPVDKVMMQQVQALKTHIERAK